VLTDTLPKEADSDPDPLARLVDAEIAAAMHHCLSALEPDRRRDPNCGRTLLSSPARARWRRSGPLQQTWHSTPFWRVTTAAAMALAADFLAEVRLDGRTLIRPLGQVTVQSGKDLERWALPVAPRVRSRSACCHRWAATCRRTSCGRRRPNCW
jgi:hypothetical protein